MNHGLLFLHAITPLHNGAGQGIGSADRPIIREVMTHFPFIQSSTLKGAMRFLAILAEIVAARAGRLAPGSGRPAAPTGVAGG